MAFETVPFRPARARVGRTVRVRPIDTGRLVVAKRNIDDNPATLDTCQVQSVPLMGLFPGGELVELVVGAWPKPAINGELAEFLR